MIQVLLALVVSQAAFSEDLREQERVAEKLAGGKYAEAESAYLAAIGFPQHKGPFLIHEMPLAVNAAAQQGHCAALRRQLDPANPQHLYLQAVLDAAAGDLTAARATMTKLLVKAQAEAGPHGANLTAHADFLAFLDWAEGDLKASQRHYQLALETAERTFAPMPFQSAITTALFADQQRAKGRNEKALQAWKDAVRDFERAGASGHAFLAVSLEAQARLLDELGKKDDATAARARAASIRSARWCR